MAATGVDRAHVAHVRSTSFSEKFDEMPMATGIDNEAMPYSPDESDSLKPRIDSTHRKLKPRHIQLIGIGG